MLPKLFQVAGLAAIAVSFVSASDASVSHSSTSHLAVRDISRRLTTLARSPGKKEYKNSTSLDKGFEDAVLFKIEGSPDTSKGDDSADTKGGDPSTEVSASVEVTCNSCYIKGQVHARLKLEESLNVTQTFHSIEESVSDVFDNITDWVKDIDVDWSEGHLEIPPPPDIDFNVELPDLPGAILEFQFDDTEIYVDLTTTFSASLTYTLKLFATETPLGIELGDDLFLGLVFSIDLILSLESELEIKHGFHIKLDDQALLTIAMFSKEATGPKFNGGQFEFLPVEVVAGSTTIRAVLQLSLRAGFAVEADLIPKSDVKLGPFDAEDFKAVAGLETRIYANIADFKTEISLGDEDEEDCDLQVEHSFQFAVGVAVGAYVGIGEQTWGPLPATEIPLFPRTFAKECITTSSKKAESTATLEARAPADDLDKTTTTLEREVTYTAIQCGETGVINCPANKQTHKEKTTTESLVTVVPSGSDASWPETITTAAVKTSTFGNNAVPLTTSSGKPKPDDPEKDDDEDFFDQETGGVSNRIIIGVSVGLGVPVLIAIVAALFFWKRRSSKKKMAPYEDTAYASVSEETRAK